jgi:GLPGLI family protein
MNLYIKKHIIALGLLVGFHSLQSQNYSYFSGRYVSLKDYQTIDSAYLKCSYKLTYLPDSLCPNIKATDRQVLLIGKNISKYYSQITLDYNLYIEKYLKTHTDGNYPMSKNGGWTYEVFKNYPQNRETVTDIGSSLYANFLYEEPLILWHWKIYDEKQTIVSYNCQKAETSFRGRNYTAWFTTDIPIPDGPWKYGGLPGLILKIYDSKGNFIFECDGLEQLKKQESIKFYKVDYSKIERKELYQLYKKSHEDRAAYNKFSGIKTMIIDDKTRVSTTIEHSPNKIPYNPIELE